MFERGKNIEKIVITMYCIAIKNAGSVAKALVLRWLIALAMPLGSCKWRGKVKKDRYTVMRN